MALLHIALLEGFRGDTVVVQVNGKEVFNKQDVKTKHQIGKAASFELETEEGSVNVKVLLPSKNLSETIVLQVFANIYLGISIEQDRIEYKVSDDPFRYA